MNMSDSRSHQFYRTYVPNGFAEENSFGARFCQASEWVDYNRENPDVSAGLLPEGNRPDRWPSLLDAKSLLPRPFWNGHEDAIACYWKVWELAFDKKLRKASPENRFVSDFNATAFNESTFMWDSAFIAIFGFYGRRAWHFQGTLDNFYCKQHPDGFICREIGEKSGEDKFQRFDPSGTGPNILPWAEWEYYLNVGDKNRLARVFPPLAAYTRWFRLNRTWPSGAYWGTGWSTGMDNQPRIPNGRHEWHEHCHQTWVDTCMQAVFADRILVRMAQVLDREKDAAEFIEEAQFLGKWINDNLWDEETSFYHDLRRDGTRIANVKTIGAYWALVAGAVPEPRIGRFLAHLENPLEFKRPHLVPSLSADTAGYSPDGGYWKGAIWAPTNYMLLRGLDQTGNSSLSHQIAVNHLDNVVSSFLKTGTLWENYAPDYFGEGRSGKDFVGWTGLVPTAVLFENVFGIKADVPNGRIVWDLRLSDEHGVENYPFGNDATLNLKCGARKSPGEEPLVSVESNRRIKITLLWGDGNRRDLTFG